MAKKTVDLGAMMEPAKATAKEIPQRGAAGGSVSDKGAIKRLSVHVDGETYKKLRMHALENDMTHQDILVDALQAYLN